MASKEHPILFTPGNARAIQELRKTQTRRLAAPRWVAGDRLWVREAWALHRQYDQFSGANIFGLPEMGCLAYKADGPYKEYIGRPRHARFMPRWASRITLEVVRTWQEPLQYISESDAIAEGIWGEPYQAGTVYYYGQRPSHGGGFDRARNCYACLWDSINGKKAPWASNPLVHATEFRVVAYG